MDCIHIMKSCRCLDTLKNIDPQCGFHTRQPQVAYIYVADKPETMRKEISVAKVQSRSREAGVLVGSLLQSIPVEVLQETCW